MKIEAKNQTGFGRVVITPRANNYMRMNMSADKLNKAKTLIQQNEKNPVIVNLHTGSFINTGNGHQTEIQYLRARVGDEVFKEGLFTSPLGVIKKAVKYADELKKLFYK